MVKNPPANAGGTGDMGLIPWSGSSPGGRNGNPLQYSCLRNRMDRGRLQSTIHAVARVEQDLETKPPQPPGEEVRPPSIHLRLVL